MCRLEGGGVREWFGAKCHRDAKKVHGWYGCWGHCQKQGSRPNVTVVSTEGARVVKMTKINHII